MSRVTGGSSALKLVVEERERRHELHHDDADDDQRKHEQHDGIHERADRPAADTADQLGVGHVAPQHRFEVAAALSRQQRGRVDARHQLAMFLEGIRKLRASLHSLVHGVEHRLEHRVGQAAAEQVERLDQWHARLEERRELLVEFQKTRRADAPTPADAWQEPRQQPHGPHRQDQQALLFQLAPKLSFALGDVDAVDELAPRGSKPTAIFHRKRLSDSRLPAIAGRRRDYSNSGRAAGLTISGSLDAKAPRRGGDCSAQRRPLASSVVRIRVT